MRLRLVAACAGMVVSGLVMAGCGGLTAAVGPASATVAAGVPVKGSVHGGQQAVVGAQVQLYAVGTTGDGSAPTALLTPAVTTDASGGFTLTNLYTCPTSSTLVYLVATGGNPGLGAGTNNTALQEMAALGQCGSLGSLPLIQVTEATTVAAAAALASFTTQPFNVGSGVSDTQALAQAFLNASQFVDLSTGASPGAGQSSTGGPSTPAVPVALINTLANIMAGCVNTAGPGSSGCSQLFSLTGNPTGTLGAMMNLQANPALYNGASLFQLAGATGPFQPQLSSPPTSKSMAVAIISPTGGSPQVFVFPATVSPGQTVWMVQKTYAPPNNPCLDIGYNYLRMNLSSYTTNGTASCGVINGVVPANVPSGSIYTEWLVSQNQQFTSYNDYSAYVNVVPAGTPVMSYLPSALVWEGTAGFQSYQLSVTLKNNTTGTLTLGNVMFTGAEPQDFSVTSDQCSKATIPNSSTCTMTLSFFPPDTGFHYATMVMPGTDASNNAIAATVQLAGSGQY